MNVRLKFLGFGLINLILGLFLSIAYRGYCSEIKFDSRLQEIGHIPVISKKQVNPDLGSNLYQQAKSITVKVLSGQSWGSGILVKKQGQIYDVVTNNHVLIFGQENQAYKIETPDGQIYSAKVIKNNKFKNKDLGLLQFQSNRNYSIARLSSSFQVTTGEQVFASGFPFESDPVESIGFVFTQGQIEMISEQSFGGGYQIGYNNRIKKGMSGGPILNIRGEVIGINGVHKYPLWGNPYIFEDGTVASPQTKAKMSQFSWGIPVQTFLKLAPEYGSSL